MPGHRHEGIPKGERRPGGIGGLVVDGERRRYGGRMLFERRGFGVGYGGLAIEDLCGLHLGTSAKRTRSKRLKGGWILSRCCDVAFLSSRLLRFPSVS